MSPIFLFSLVFTFVFATVSSKLPPQGCKGTIQPPAGHVFYENLHLAQNFSRIPDEFIPRMEELVDKVSEMIANDYPADTPSWYNTPYVYWGTSGRGAFAMRMVRDSEQQHMKKRTTSRDPKVWLARAKDYIDASLNQTKPYVRQSKGFAFQKGRTGILAVAAVVYDRLGQSDKVLAFLDEINWVFDQARSTDYFDWENGFAGLVYTGTYVNNYFGREVVSQHKMDRILQFTYEQGMRMYNQTTGAMQFELFEGHFLTGMGSHGSGSPIYALLQSETMMKNETIRQHVKSTMDYFLSIQTPEGQITGDHRPDKKQWCHGIPGLLAPLGAAYRVFGEEKYLQAGLLGAQLTRKVGILTKGMQLCHGVAGNVYMMIDFYNQTKDPRVLSMAISMILTSLDTPELSDPEKWVSWDCLPEGMFVSSSIGAVLLYSDLLHNLDDLSKLQMLSFHFSI